MAVEGPKNSGNDFYAKLESSTKLTQEQLTRLDRLDGNEDGVITESIFNHVTSIINNEEPPEGLDSNTAQATIDILRNIDVSKVDTQMRSPVFLGVDSNKLKESLKLNDNQINRLIALSQNTYGEQDLGALPTGTISKNIAAIALCIARSQPTPPGAPEDLCNEIREIITPPPEQEKIGF